MGLKLMAELGLDGTGFVRGLNQAEAKAHGVMEGIKGFVVGAVGIYTVERALAKTVETAAELTIASQRMGIGFEKLQVLRRAAQESNVEFGKLETTLEHVSRARQKALTPGAGGQSARWAFRQMGVSPEMLRSQSSAQLFMGPMSQAMKGGNPDQLATTLKEIFGKGVGEIIPVLKTDFAEVEAKLRSLGALLDAETAVKLKFLGEGLSLLSQIIIGTLAPAMVKLAEFILSQVIKTGKTVAGASGFYGAGTAGMGIGKTAGTLLKTAGYGAADIFARVFHGRTAEQSRGYLQGKLGGMGFNMVGANAGAATSEEPWLVRQKEFEALLAKMAEEAKKLNNSKEPAGGGFSGDPIHMGKKSLEVPSDSLTKVGNFLGGSQGALQRLAQRRTDLLQQIARNTSHQGASGSHGGNFGRMTDRHHVQVPEV